MLRDSNWRKTRRNTKTRRTTATKLNLHATLGLGVKPRLQQFEGRFLTTELRILPFDVFSSCEEFEFIFGELCCMQDISKCLMIHGVTVFLKIFFR